ncbi:radical SAM protein [Chitinimonas naiadis]
MGMRQLTLQLTWACDIRCAHCSQAHVRTHLDMTIAKRAIRGLLRRGQIDRLSFTGGEPFLRYDNMLALASYGAKHGLNFGVVTNGRWAVSEVVIENKLDALIQQGLDLLVISYDRYHQAFVPDERIALLLRVAAGLNLAVHLYVSRDDATPIPTLKQQLMDKFSLALHEVSVRDVVPLGHGAALPISMAAMSYFDLDTECPARNEYNLWPDGELLPCCSAGTHAGLSLGNLHRESIDSLIAKRRASRLMGMLHRHDLAELVVRLPEPMQVRLASAAYVSACHLCHAILSEPDIHSVVEEIDPDRIGLVDKLLHTPSRQARLAESIRKQWSGPPIIAIR